MYKIKAVQLAGVAYYVISLSWDACQQGGAAQHSPQCWSWWSQHLEVLKSCDTVAEPGTLG